MYQDIIYSFRSRIARIGFVIIGIGIFLFPLPSIFFLIAHFILFHFMIRKNKKESYKGKKQIENSMLQYYSKYQSKCSVLVSGVILVFLSFFLLDKHSLLQSSFGVISLTFSQIVFSNFKEIYLQILSENFFREMVLPNILVWVTGINLFGWGLSGCIVGIGLLLQKSSSEILMNETVKEENIKEDLIESRGGINLEDKGHVGAFGSTGTGKTANVLKYVEKAIKVGQFTVVIDGKGGTKEYDLNTVTEKLAKKYNRKLYVINQSNISKTDGYNPFADITETELKDLLSSLTEWSEEHYRIQALTYWQMMGRILRAADIQLNFNSIIKFSNPSELKSLVENLQAKEIISKELAIRAKQVISANRETVVSAIGRLAIYNDGDGRYLFRDNGFNLRKAYRERAVVVVYLNDFKYSDFARSLGKLVVAEYKLFLSLKDELNDDEEALLVMDELGVYVEDNYEGLLNRTRSYGVKTIICMQVIADIIKVDESLTKQLLGNLTNFLIMRTDNDTANTISEFIGTDKYVKQTTRSNEEGNTGESSNNVVDEFGINPNKIKRLPNLVGYYYSHNRPGKPSKFITEFLDLGEGEEQKVVENKTKRKNKRIVISKSR